jgi:hypothetical protein
MVAHPLQAVKPPTSAAAFWLLEVPIMREPETMDGYEAPIWGSLKERF